MKKAIVLFILFFGLSASIYAQKPPVVKNFTAIVEQCFCTGNNSKFHVVMKWDLIPKCIRYRIIRDGKQLTLLTNNENIHIDRAVLNSKSYTYQVGGLVPSGNLQLSLPVKVTIPKFATKNPEAPTNLRTFGFWDNGAFDILQWEPSPEATSYNIYRYDNKIGSSKTNSFTVSKLIYQDHWTYTVTAVDKYGLESLPSNLGMARGEYAPNYNFGWRSNPPSTPGKYAVNPEWNRGRPRNFIKWQDQQVWGQDAPGAYNVYRDGVKVCSGLWSQYYIDTNVVSGKTYKYQIGSVNRDQFKVQETLGPIVEITTAFGPKDLSSTPIKINGTEPNDDSVVVKFDYVPGALDYRVYVEGNPNTVKYSSGFNMVEMNGLISNQSYNLIVEALDKMGPYQKIDGIIGPGASGPNGEIHAAVNGHGDPSNEPNVIAKSLPYRVTTVQRKLTGEQVFLDNFRDFQPIVQLPTKQDIFDFRFGANNQYKNEAHLFLKWFENDKWNFFLDDLDTNHSTVFLMGSHFMDTIYDGASLPRPGWAHLSNGVMLMSPKKTANISGDKVLHVTFEVDPHFSGRRWCDVLLLPAGETVYSGKAADKIAMNTKSGKLFRWAINAGGHTINVDTGYNADGSRKSYSVPVKFADRGSIYSYPAPYRNINNLTEYKVGTFVANSVVQNGNDVNVKLTSKFFDSNKFPAFNLESNYSPKSGWIRFAEFGGAAEYEWTPETFKMIDDIDFNPNNWWIKETSKASLNKLMDAYSSNRSGAIIYRSTMNAVSGKYEGEIFFRPSVDRRDFPLNRTWQGLDRRVQFDLYVSKNRVVVVEDGYLVADSPLPVDFPFEEINVNYTHLIYHTYNEIGEQRTWNPDNAYWINFRPFADERHWDNMGFEVLTSFPNVKLF
jgi:fibronectin type 3 domain-containing protein